MESISQQNGQIFQEICQLITEKDFQEGQINFIYCHSHKFSDEDENKFEYTQLHQDYISLLDQAIDAQLESKFDDQQIKSFYYDFTQNYHQYEQTNSEAVNLLHGYLNFQSFKLQMLKMKGGVINQTQNEQSHFDTSEQAQEITYEMLSKEDMNDPSLGWKKISENLNPKDGYTYTVHARLFDVENNINIARIDMRLQGIQPDQWYEMIKDGPPIDNVIERRVVRVISQFEKILYVRMRLGVFITDRDNLINIKKIPQQDGSIVIQIRSVQDSEVPEIPNVIRIEMLKVQRVQQCDKNPNYITVTDFSKMNLKGYFPVRLFNLMMGVIFSKGIPVMYKSALKCNPNY